MDRLKLIQRVRTLTRDLSNSIFRESDIIDFINEGVDRFKQAIPEFRTMSYLMSSTATPTLIPSEFRYLLAVYSASRCFGQDERHYQATTLMNEFETKLDELKQQIQSGEIVILDPVTNEPIETNNDTDYVDLEPYFGKYNNDIDLGVEGVE